MRQGELILCKEKIAPLELTKVWTKGGDIKKGVLVIKTAEAMDIVAAMNLQNLALKNTELENHFEKGQSAAVTLMTSAKSGENSQPVLPVPTRFPPGWKHYNDQPRAQWKD